MGLDGNPKLEVECASWDLSTMRVQKVRKRFRWFDHVPDQNLQRHLLCALRKRYGMNPNVPMFGAEDFQRRVDVHTDTIELSDTWYEEEMRCDVPR